MAHSNILIPYASYRIEHFTPEDLCLVYALDVPFEQGRFPNVRRVPDNPEFASLYLKNRTDLLAVILKRNNYTPKHGKKFLWPEARINSLKQRAKKLGYAVVLRGAATKYFSLGPDDFTVGKKLPLLLDPVGEAATAKLVPVVCAMVSFVKKPPTAPICGFSLDTALMEIDTLGLAPCPISLWLIDDDEADKPPASTTHIIATLEAVATGSGKAERIIDKGVQLARAAKQYNAWCKTLYGEESLTIRVFDNKVEVERIRPHRPLPHWTRIKWCTYRPRVSAYIMEAVDTVGGGLLSRKQLETLRNTVSVKNRTKPDVQLKCEVDKHSAMYISDSTVKIRTTPQDGDVLLEKVTYIKLIPK